MAAQAQISQTTVDNPNATVLVVDDESRIRALMKDALEQQVDTIIEAQDGQQALSALARERVSLMLLDYYMPGMDGNQVCQHVREQFSELRLPIIMVTCNNDPRHLAKSLDSGATDFIRKPFHLSEFRARVRTALKRQQQFAQVTHAQDNVLHFSPTAEHPDMFTPNPIRTKIINDMPGLYPAQSWDNPNRYPHPVKADVGYPTAPNRFSSFALGRIAAQETNNTEPSDFATFVVTVWIEGLILGRHPALQVGDNRLFLRFDPLLFKLDDKLRIAIHQQVGDRYPIQMMDANVKRRTLAGIEVEVSGTLPWARMN